MSFQAETDWLLVHTMLIPVRWGDMDAMGHVNNTVYFRYIEHARVEWMREIDATPNPNGEGPVIINAHCTFRKQITYPATIELKTLVGAPGRSSFETRYEMRLLQEDGQAGPEIYAEAGAKVVWVNFLAQKSTPLPDRIRALLESPVAVQNTAPGGE